MTVYKLILKKGEPMKIRLHAFTNLFCVVYLITVTLLVTHTSFFHILPACYFDQGWTIFLHRVAISYIFISAVSQFVTCVFTDSGIDRTKTQPFSKDQLKSKTKNGRTVKREFLHYSDEMTRIVSDNSAKNMALETMHFCKSCNLIVPARTHHCILCKTCVTKRDHHCYFMGVCIGKNNHPYFICFTLYMGIGTFYGLLLLAKYLSYLYGFRFQGPQSFFTLFANTMISLMSGVIPTARFLFIFILLYISLFGTMFAFGFFFWHLLIVSRGQTTYEARVGIKKFSRGSITKNFKDVFTRGFFMTVCVPFWDLVMNDDQSKKA